MTDAATPTPGMPTDTELIALLRKRLHEVEDAIFTFMDAMEEAGRPRITTWELMKAEIVRTDDLPYPVQRFLQVYEESLPVRKRAVDALTKALVRDFKTDVLCGYDWTEEQRAFWLDCLAEEGGE